MDFKQSLIELFESVFNEKVVSVEDIKSDGSNRAIVRIKSELRSVVGIWGPDKKENKAFVEFSKHFKSLGLNVPEIFAFDEKKQIYLETDLGYYTLFDIIKERRINDEFPQGIVDLYKKAIEHLSLFQFYGIKDFNTEWCYPRKEFDTQSMMWDCNYFKYYFLKLGSIPFDEQSLEDDFKTLVSFISQAPRDFFLYRDFQSRNIMVKGEELYFIDYQGGRKGYVAYDVASLLFDAKADIPPQIRQDLLYHYLSLDIVKKNIDIEAFLSFYYYFVIIRLMQAMGAYGLRGFYERKHHFLTSVPYVIKNLEWLLSNVEFKLKIPELKKVFRRIVSSTYLRSFTDKKFPLNLRIYSFSYNDGIPHDPFGHGGGFVFDLRCLPNPGKNPLYSNLTGKDEDVEKFLENSKEVQKYYMNVKELINQAVESYLSRNFTELYIAFGCTGGRHRSVYMAEKLYKDFSQKKDVRCYVKHLAIEKENSFKR